MRQNSWPALIIVIVVVSFALFSFAISSNVSFSQIQAITGTNPEATVGDTLIFISSDGTVSITGSASADTLDFSAPAGGGGGGLAYNRIQDEGSDLTQRRILNFLGAGVACVDDAVDSTDCTIPGGVSVNSFETMDAPAGTDPVADSATDTLLFLSTNSSISITGSAAADSLDFVVNEANLSVYATVQDESSNLTQRRLLNFLGAGVSCVDDAVDSTDCTISGGGSGIAVEEDDGGVAAAATTLDFGPGFDVSESPANEANITFDILEVGLANDSIWIGSSGNLAVESGLPNCVDTSGQHLNYTQATNTVSCGTTEGESQLLFFTMNAPSGTDPQADTPTDTLNFTVVGSDLTITGNSTTDTLEFNLNTPAGTNITADLEEETHASEHNIGGNDELPFYGLIDDEGTPLTARRTLNFIGAGVTCVDDGAGAETDCTISGGASQNLFETMDVPFGTDPVADTATDILIFQSVDGTVSISGSATADSLDFSAIDLNCVDCIGTVEISDDYILNIGDTITGDFFVQDGNGIIVGHSAQINFGAISEFQILGTGTPDSSMGFARFQDNTSGPDVRFLKSRGVTIGAITIVQDGDTLGRFRFQGDDGTDFNTTGAEILAEVDGTPALNNIPAALVFRTRQDGGALAERLRIDNTGVLTLSSNSLIFGLGTATNPTLTFNTDEAGDDTLLFDAATDNRFELSNSLDIIGVFTESGNNIITTIDDEGIPLTRRRTLNFIGAGVTCVDDSPGAETDCTIPGGGGNIFETIDVPTGTDPVADSATDTLFFESQDSTVTITGSSVTDTVNFVVNQANLDFYSTVKDEDTPLTQRRLLNFTGAGVSCVDDAVDSSDCTIPVQNLFETIDAPIGTDPVADTPTDTLQFLTTTGTISITGSAAGDSLDFGINEANFPVYNRVQDESGNLLQRRILNFVGAGVSCVDDGADSTDCTISGGGSTNSFETMDAPAGTDPVADSATDTLIFQSTDGTISITGSAAADSLDFNVVESALSFYSTIKDEDTPVTQRRLLNFTGAGVSCTDDAVDSTDCVITGGGGSNSFTDWTPITGTTPVADSATDTMLLQSTLGTISITGSAAADSLDFNVVVSALSFYSTVQDEGGNLLQRRILNFIGAGVSCVDDGADSTDCTIVGDLGAEDLQATYDAETAPALITITDAIGGLIFDGDLETVDPTLTIRNATANEIGLLIDNDDEAANEASPLLMLADSTSAAGDNQFSLRVQVGGSFQILGDDNLADLQINSSGNLRMFSDQIDFGTDSVSTNVTLFFRTNNTPEAQLEFDNATDERFEFNYGLEIQDNDLTFGLGTATNPTLTFNTDEGTDATIIFDAVTDNRFEFNKDVNLDVEREAFWFISGDVSTGLKPIRIVLRRAVTYQDMICSVNTTGTTSAIQIDIQENGTDIFAGTEVSIAAGSNSDISGAPSDTTGAANDVLKLEVELADSGNTGAELTCQLRFRHLVDLAP